MSGAAPGGLRLLAQQARPFRAALAGAVALAVLATALELVPPLVIWRIAAEVLQPDGEAWRVMLLALLGLGGVLLRFVLAAAGNLMGHAVAFRLQHRLRRALLDRIAALPAMALEGQGGTLKQTVVEDVGRLEGILSHTLPDVVSGLALPLLTLPLLLAVDWGMTLAALALLPLAILAQTLIGRASGQAAAQWAAAEAEANRQILAFVRGVATLKAFNREARSLARLRNAVQAVAILAGAITRRARYPYALFNSALTSALVVVLPVGLWRVSQGGLALPELMLFLALGPTLTAPLTRTVFALTSARRVAAAADRIGRLLAAPVVPAPVVAERPEGHAIRFERVRFRYPDGRLALDIPTLEIPEGGLTALVGRSGAGKTTLAKLLLGLLDCSEGRITLGGADIARMALADLAARISVVFQDPVLFHGSIAENIALARPEAPREVVEAAARAAQLHGFISGLPQGYDTLIGDRGTRLSGGQKQRLAIARAILKDAPLLILDEATAFADAETEREIQLALATAAAGRTVLMIAHRLATVEKAERIIVLTDGRIEAMGRHEELLAASPTYTALRNAQAQAARWGLRGHLAEAVSL